MRSGFHANGIWRSSRTPECSGPKNPYALLAAYNVAFSGVQDVVLVLKTYRRDHSSTEERDALREMIVNFRSHCTLPHFPKIVLVVANMSRQEMLGLHKRGDAFVLLQRSEGWGLPHFEAAMCGKPVITPDFGGQTDFLKPEHSFLVGSSLTPVIGMKSFSDVYLSTQYWCEPNMKEAIDQMRYVYEHRNEAQARGQKARQFISDNFTWDKVGGIIVDRLRQLDGGASTCQP
jgi:glycosyltransferase involved in cell wall biosynthesis